MNFFKNKKLHVVFWFLVLLYAIWGFINPEHFTFHKWGTMPKGQQYIYVLLMFGISIAKLVQLYLAIKKEKKHR